MKHTHHIIPKHMGGTDDPNNLIELTVKEHAEAHRILYEEHGKWEDYCAWQALSGRLGQEEILRMKQGMANKGKKRTPEQIEKYREAARKRNEKWKKEGKWEEMNAKRSNTQTGYVKTKEHLENWKKSREENFKKRKGHSPETIAKIKAKRALQKTVRGVPQDV